MIIKKIIVSKKGTLEIEPEFNAEKKEINFHPIPAELIENVKEGELWAGDFGVTHISGKVDKKGNNILVQFFIPKEKINSGLQW